MSETQHQATNVKRAVGDPARPGRYEMLVTWDDGRESHYAWGYLRALCPCANCRHQVIARVQANPADVNDTAQTQVHSLQHVGHYALGVAWNDGHQSIFPWDYLHSMDPGAATLEERVETLKQDKRLL